MLNNSILERLFALPYAPSGITLIAFIGAFLILLLIKWLILGRLKVFLAHCQYAFASLLVESLDWPLIILFVCVDLVLLKCLLAYFDMQTSFANSVIRVLLLFGVVVAIVVFINQFLTGVVSGYAKKSETLKNSEAIVKGVARIVILSIGLLVLLSTLGISITPVIASLGITSLAVALALQPTLKNFFSGVQLVMDKPIRVDDFIELDSGEQGFVEKIGWR